MAGAGKMPPPPLPCVAKGLPAVTSTGGESKPSLGRATSQIHSRPRDSADERRVTFSTCSIQTDDSMRTAQSTQTHTIMSTKAVQTAAAPEPDSQAELFASRRALLHQSERWQRAALCSAALVGVFLTSCSTLSTALASPAGLVDMNVHISDVDQTEVNSNHLPTHGEESSSVQPAESAAEIASADTSGLNRVSRLEERLSEALLAREAERGGFLQKVQKLEENGKSLRKALSCTKQALEAKTTAEAVALNRCKELASAVAGLTNALEEERQKVCSAVSV